MVRGFLLNLRMVRAGPSIAKGGMIAFTREPSSRRASHMGLDSSMRRPTWLTMRSMMRKRCLSSAKTTSESSMRPWRSMKTWRGLLTMTSVMVGSWIRGSSGPRPIISLKISSINRSRSLRPTTSPRSARVASTPSRTWARMSSSTPIGPAFISSTSRRWILVLSA
ncbi:hypothetical protein D3C72_819090 [compost metagenome]